MKTTNDVRKKIITFLALTFALSSIFYYLIISAKSLRAGHGLFVLGLMWCPGVSALVTQLIYQKNLRGLGWGWGKTKYQAWSYAIPFLYALSAYAIVWTTGIGGFYNEKFLGNLSSRLPGGLGAGLKSPYALIALYTLLVATIGVVQSCISALGEEIGWRGLLIPSLAKMTSFPKAALIGGVVWSIWHYPILLFADYNNGTPAWYGLSCFTVMVIGISYVFAWMRLKSGSLWTGMLLHASHNAFIQGVFTPLTFDTGPTRYVIDEFGVALPIISMIVAYIFWRKRSELGDAQLSAEAAPSPESKGAAAAV
jgi:membrane protease YdiL (CAAX protease family)